MADKFIEVPLGGNSFITNKPQSERDGITAKGFENWSNENYTYCVYFKPAVDAELTIYLAMNAARCGATIAATVDEKTNVIEIKKGDTKVLLGTWATKAGYVEVKLQGIKRNGKVFAAPYSLIVEGVADDEMASYARLSDEKDFYWIRRGPSVHCQYDISNAGDDVEWFYNEATIMPGEDPHGTYGMAIGFHGGYFGMQVCSEASRKIIFSIWSPFVTDNPEEIPEDKKVIVLKKRPDVYTGEFGNEGSGGQSFLSYNWESGKTYRFLCHIVPRENNKTEFTGYFFFPETGKWELLCSFLRPETQTYFKGPYSFLESFIDVNGSRFRKARFQNQWAVTKGGRWFPVNTMTLTGDATACKAQRQDYNGGVEGNYFYLCNCGFFSQNGVLRSKFSIDQSAYKQPDIDLDEILKL